MDGSFTLGFERGKGAFFEDEKKSRSRPLGASCSAFINNRHQHRDRASL
jgi:hypothetical protein